MNHDTWVWRCCMCGEYAHGHGEVPELREHWVCGPCAAEEPNGHVVVVQHVGSTACHYVVVDLDLDREG